MQNKEVTYTNWLLKQGIVKTGRDFESHSTYYRFESEDKAKAFGWRHFKRTDILSPNTVNEQLYQLSITSTEKEALKARYEEAKAKSLPKAIIYFSPARAGDCRIAIKFGDDQDGQAAQGSFITSFLNLMGEGSKEALDTRWRKNAIYIRSKGDFLFGSVVIGGQLAIDCGSSNAAGTLYKMLSLEDCATLDDCRIIFSKEKIGPIADREVNITTTFKEPVYRNKCISMLEVLFATNRNHFITFLNRHITKITSTTSAEQTQALTSCFQGICAQPESKVCYIKLTYELKGLLKHRFSELVDNANAELSSGI